jgi:hypothetical protein
MTTQNLVCRDITIRLEMEPEEEVGSPTIYLHLPDSVKILNLPNETHLTEEQSVAVLGMLYGVALPGLPTTS